MLPLKYYQIILHKYMHQNVINMCLRSCMRIMDTQDGRCLRPEKNRYQNKQTSKVFYSFTTMLLCSCFLQWCDMFINVHLNSISIFNFMCRIVSITRIELNSILQIVKSAKYNEL